MLRAIIIDDIEAIRQVNIAVIQQYSPEVAIIAEADSVKTGVEAIRKFLPDLVFLDVEMGDGTGFDLLKQFDAINFKVIFITGYEEFAITAFRFSAVDFLMKPIDPDDLVQAVRKVSETLSKDILELKFNTLFSNMTQPKNLQKLVLKTADKVYSINIQDIVHCESYRNYTTFHLINGEAFVVSTTLKEYETLLVPMGFFRAHQSHLVNMNYFDHFLKKDSIIVMKDKSRIPLSTRKKDELMALIEAL